MKSVTGLLPEDAAAWLRVRAARDGRSVSRWLADLPADMRHLDDEYDLTGKPRPLRSVDERKPTRNELRERSGIR